MAIQTINPATNKVEKSFSEMVDEDVSKAISKSAETFEIWKKTDCKFRSALLHKVAGLLREKRKPLLQ